MSVMYIILEGDVCDGGRQYVYVVVGRGGGGIMLWGW